MAIKHLPPEKNTPRLVNGNSENAPFIYYDGVIAYSTNRGMAQLELAANHLLAYATPDASKQTVVPKIATVAHLRCSIDTLRDMARVIDTILDEIDARRASAEKGPEPEAK